MSDEVYISCDGVDYERIDERYVRRLEKQVEEMYRLAAVMLEQMGIARGDSFEDMLAGIRRYMAVKHGMDEATVDGMSLNALFNRIADDAADTPMGWPTVTEAATLLQAITDNQITLQAAKARISKAATKPNQNGYRLRSTSILNRRRIDPQSLITFLLAEREARLSD